MELSTWFQMVCEEGDMTFPDFSNSDTNVYNFLHKQQTLTQ